MNSCIFCKSELVKDLDFNDYFCLNYKDCNYFKISKVNGILTRCDYLVPAEDGLRYLIAWNRGELSISKESSNYRDVYLVIFSGKYDDPFACKIKTEKHLKLFLNM